MSFTLVLLSGSPPRMRGKREVETVVMSQIRITPAHAGKTGYLQL